MGHVGQHVISNVFEGVVKFHSEQDMITEQFMDGLGVKFFLKKKTYMMIHIILED